MTAALQPPAVPAQWYPPGRPKSAVAAGLLQLFFGWFGRARFPLSMRTFIHAILMFSAHVNDKHGHKRR
jgi:hypothetical protein